LIVKAPSEEKTDDSKHSCYELLVQVLNHFSKYHTKILLDCEAKLRRDDIFNPTVRNDSLHQDINHKGVRVANFATSKNLVIKSKVFQHQNIHKYT